MSPSDDLEQIWADFRATKARSICSSRRNSSSESGTVSSRRPLLLISLGSTSTYRYPRPKTHTHIVAGT